MSTPSFTSAQKGQLAVIAHVLSVEIGVLDTLIALHGDQSLILQRALKVQTLDKIKEAF